MIRIGVAGAGHLGRFHIQQLKEIPIFSLTGFYDPSPEVRKNITSEFSIPHFDSLQELLDANDAVDIVTPTKYHFETAAQALRQSKHVFLEKPITQSIKEGKELLALAREAQVKVQVGHVERFNPAFVALDGYELNPMFIESHRLSTWSPRGTDVSVILDLMIHDLDLIHKIVKSPLKRLSASGVAVISETPDIANVRLEFANGCVANLTASRISLKKMRKMRLFQKNAYVTIDFLDKHTEVLSFENEGDTVSPDKLKFVFDTGSLRKNLIFETPEIKPANAIKEELNAFGMSILENKPVTVSLEDGYLALETACKILDKIK
jgi:predicted dehydrogenase